MRQETYLLLDRFMKESMKDSAHDQEHVYRVLYVALEIAETENQVDYDLLITACLLHDIGREEQLKDPSLCHAQVGAKKAYTFLGENGFEESFCRRVSRCIATHRFRKGEAPESIEAKILFDADKIDVAGATGIARTLIYKGEIGEPLYRLTENGDISHGSGGEGPSFFQEYKTKLEKIYGLFYTEKGREMARARQAAAQNFYEALYRELREPWDGGKKRLAGILGAAGQGD